MWVSWPEQTNVRGPTFKFHIAPPSIYLEQLQATCDQRGKAGVKVSEAEVSYWAVALPLTVLSAYLILWRPQQLAPPN